jgi:prepilin-type processing-associated H-X9-DG protein
MTLGPTWIESGRAAESTRFEREYPAAARTLESRFATIQGKARVTRTNPRAGGKPHEEDAVFASVNLQTWIGADENSSSRAVVVSAYLCPGGPLATQARPVPPADGSPSRTLPTLVAFTSYGAFSASEDVVALPFYDEGCQADPVAVAKSDGCFNDVSPITHASITDGLSNTMILADKSRTILQRLNEPEVADRCNAWVDAMPEGAGLDGAFPPNMYRHADLKARPAWLWSARSLHPGGVNTLFADGSARFITDTIDAAPVVSGGLGTKARSHPGLWQKLITRNGGEVVTPP